MREYEFPLVEEFKKGLRPYANRVRNAGGLIECFNVFPDDEGVKPHETVISLNDATKGWGSQENLAPVVTTRDVTINIQEYVNSSDIGGAMVYIDGTLAGTTDIAGELLLVAVVVGGHSIRITKAGYVDSDADALLNDYFVVT